MSRPRRRRIRAVALFPRVAAAAAAVAAMGSRRDGRRGGAASGTAIVVSHLLFESPQPRRVLGPMVIGQRVRCRKHKAAPPRSRPGAVVAAQHTKLLERFRLHATMRRANVCGEVIKREVSGRALLAARFCRAEKRGAVQGRAARGGSAVLGIRADQRVVRGVTRRAPETRAMPTFVSVRCAVVDPLRLVSAVLAFGARRRWRVGRPLWRADRDMVVGPRVTSLRRVAVFRQLRQRPTFRRTVAGRRVRAIRWPADVVGAATGKAMQTKRCAPRGSSGATLFAGC